MSYHDHSAFAANDGACPNEAPRPLPAPDAFGPVYPALPSVAKHRRVKDPTPDQSRAYGEAVMAGIRALQAADLARELRPARPKVDCASGTGETTGPGIMKAVRRQHDSQLQAGANADRARRTDDDIRKQYAAAMAEKRAREAAQADCPKPDECDATGRFLSRIEAESAATAPDEPHPRAAVRAAWNEAIGAECDALEAIEAEPSEPAYPDADDDSGPVCTGAPGMGAALQGGGVGAASLDRAVRALPKSSRARKPTDAERLEVERLEIQAAPLPRSQAEWRALSSRMRGWKREMERRSGRSGMFGLSVGPDTHRQIRIERHARLYVYNGASPATHLNMIAFHRRQYLAGIMPETRLADARVFAREARREGPVPLPDIGRPYRVCGGALNEAVPGYSGAARDPAPPPLRVVQPPRIVRDGRERRAASMHRIGRELPPMAIPGPCAAMLRSASSFEALRGSPHRSAPPLAPTKTLREILRDAAARGVMLLVERRPATVCNPGGSIYLALIYASPMRRGHGSDTMRELVRYADCLDLPIDLHRTPFDGGPDDSTLARFYRGFGFVDDDGGGHMVRLPHATEQHPDMAVLSAHPGVVVFRRSARSRSPPCGL